MAYLYDTEVLLESRQRGVASSLIDKLMGMLKNGVCVEVWLGTDIDNEPAKALYAKTGAVRTDDTFYHFTYHL